MKILRTFDYDDPPPANLSGVMYMIGFDDWPVFIHIQEVPAVDPNKAVALDRKVGQRDRR